MSELYPKNPAIMSDVENFRAYRRDGRGTISLIGPAL